MTGGMDNPVDVVFTPGGERIFTTTFFQHPAAGRRDGLIHAVYGAVYGKDHDVVHEHPWTSPSLMPVLTHMGPAAPCGLTRYESNAFGADYRDNLFACQFNMRKVSRHVLQPDGATFQCVDSDFLVSDNHDFHPTDVIEDADGSLLVIDTGGWYKLCCPTSQLAKPDVLGGIYRIRRKGAPRLDDPRGLKLEWKEVTPAVLAKRLDDPRPAVRRRAVAVLGRRGETALSALAPVVKTGGTEARRNAVWAATRIDHVAARSLVRTALADRDESVRQAALHSISLWRDRKATDDLCKLLKSATPHNRRAAAEALGRIGDRDTVGDLLAALAEPKDRFLEHSLIYALIEIGDRERTVAGLSSPNVRIRRAALIALDQMDGGNLDVKDVIPELASNDPVLRETATWIVGHHPAWGAELNGHLRDRLRAVNLSAEQRDETVALLARLSPSPAVQGLLADGLRDPKFSPEARRRALRAMAAAPLKVAPEPWLAALADTLGDDDAETVRLAVTAARSLPMPKERPEKLAQALLRVGTDGKQPEPVRLAALAAVPGGVMQVSPDLFAFVVRHLDREQPVATRSVAAETLSRAKLTPEQLIALTAVLKTTGPMEINRLLDAYTRTTDDKVGLALLAALNAPEVRAALRSQTVRQCLEKYGPKVKTEAEKLYAVLDTDLIKQRAKIEEIAAVLKDGDVRRGQAVFNSSKAACASCHTIGYVGGKVGPDLTRIGKIRTERDLLESIVLPSASFVRSYEPVIITTKRGKTHSGVVRKDSADEVVLALNATEEVRIPREEIEDMRPGTVSIMPAGLDQQLSVRELADLVAFLKACQ
jgi:putative heme-binding domain-containing protein